LGQLRNTIFARNAKNELIRDACSMLSSIFLPLSAFRRGLGTRLNEAGANSKEIQAILRHADVSTTMAYYILPDHKRAKAGLRKQGQVAQRKYGIKV
jgi:integrase